MSLLNNSPTFSYIQATGTTVIYNKTLYNVYDFHTNKKYIYWNIETPNVFRASNVRPESYNGQRLILVNENGIAIEVQNEDIEVYFDGNNAKNLEDYIYGIHEKNDEFEEKFTAVEVSIDGIQTTVGELKETDTLIKEEISSVKQTATEIDLKVSNVTKKFNNTELRDEVNAIIIKCNSSAGIFKSDFLEFAKDNEINSTERTKINAHITVLNTNKNNLLTTVNKIIAVADEQKLTTEKTVIINAKNAFVTASDGLRNNMNNVISDNIVTLSDRTLIINSFAQYTLKLNELKNTLDKVIILGMGGKIIEEFSNITLKSDSIISEVARVENGVKTNTSKITQTANEIKQEVTDTKNNLQSQITQNAGQIDLRVTKNGVISSINMSSERIIIDSARIDFTGYTQFLSTNQGTTIIHGGNIKTGTIEATHIKANSITTNHIQANTIKAEHIHGKHFYGVSVTTTTTNNVARAVLTGDGINFYSSTSHAGKLSFDSNGDGTAESSMNRLWLRSLGNYALKIQSSGDTSIEANGGYNSIWIKGYKIAFNIGNGGFWVNNKLIDFENLTSDAKFG